MVQINVGDTMEISVFGDQKKRFVVETIYGFSNGDKKIELRNHVWLDEPQHLHITVRQPNKEIKNDNEWGS